MSKFEAEKSIQANIFMELFYHNNIFCTTTSTV